MTKNIIKLSRNMSTLVDEEDYELVNSKRWTYDPTTGYAYRRRINNLGINKKIYLHREIANTPLGLVTDHINGDKLDNRKSNLRICTGGENKLNSGLMKSNTSGYKYILRDKRKNKWVVAINRSTRCHKQYRRQFEVLEDALDCRNILIGALHGEFGRLE